MSEPVEHPAAAQLSNIQARLAKSFAFLVAIVALPLLGVLWWFTTDGQRTPNLQWWVWAVAALALAGAGVVGKQVLSQVMDVLSNALFGEIKLRRLMQLSGDWYWTQNEQHRITRIVFKGKEQQGEGDHVKLPFTGLARWEVEGLSVLDTQLGWDGFKALLNAQQPYDHVAFDYQPPGHNRTIFESSGRPVWSPKQEFLGYEGVSSNITQKTLNERLIALERHLLQGVLLSAPLGGLAGSYAQGLRQCLSLDCELLLGYRESNTTEHWVLRGAPPALRIREAQSKTIWSDPLQACVPMAGVEQSGLLDVWVLKDSWVPEHWKVELGIRKVWMACRQSKEQGQPEYWLMVAQRGKDDPPKQDVTRALAALRLLGLCLERRAFENELQAVNEGLEQRIAERTQELTRTNTELEAFTYTVSHDLRAPLRAIDGFSSILREDYSTQIPPDAAGLLERISNNARQMGGLIDGLLDFSRLLRTEVTRVEVDLNHMLAQVLESLDAQRKAEVLCPRLPHVMADPVLMQQVWMNLIDNALKFSGKVDQPRIEITCTESPTHYQFTVQDNGAGFDMKYVDKLFNVFERLHHKKDFDGTGVGLAIVKRIIERHGGQITAVSQVGQGACFTFTLSR